MAALGLCLLKPSNCKLSLGFLKRIQPWAAAPVCCSQTNIQPIRCKGTKRFKLPPTAKEKEKWQPRKKVVAEEIMSPKELKEFMERVPADDVWIQKYYPPARFYFEQAINMHREVAMPEVHDNADGLVYVDAELDLSTKKKTKFLGAFSGTVLLPHNFVDNIQSRVVAITKMEEDKAKASELGAVFVGGLDVIRMIEKGEIKQDDFDYVVLNMDMLVEAALIKKTLKDRFPAKKKGNLGIDTAAMVTLFVKGRSFESVKVSESVGKLTFTFGTLNMDMEQLKANFKAIIEAVAAQKPHTTGGAPIFSKVRITCPPSTEKFLVDDNSIFPEGTISRQTVIEKEKPPKAKSEDDEEGEEEEDTEEKRTAA